MSAALLAELVTLLTPGPGEGTCGSCFLPGRIVGWDDHFGGELCEVCVDGIAAERAATTEAST